MVSRSERRYTPTLSLVLTSNSDEKPDVMKNRGDGKDYIHRRTLKGLIPLSHALGLQDVKKYRRRNEKLSTGSIPERAKGSIGNVVAMASFAGCASVSSSVVGR